MRLALTALVVLAFAPHASAEDAPRRLLFVQLADYLYLNPLTHAAPGGPDRTRDAAARLAAGLHVPTGKHNDQLFVYADTDPTTALPTKDALAQVIGAFCDTTRPQDRVVIYIGAHAVEKDGKAFVVPIDGDPDTPDSLLPVADVYARLKALKAAQKVVIWDVCRDNPERGHERRELGPMTPGLFAALTAPPEGVEALVSCSAGEHSAEYFAPRGPAGVFAGSAYLDALRQAAEDLRPEGAKPDAPVPVAALHASAQASLAALAKLTGAKQTPAARGAAPKDAASFDPKDKPAKRFELPVPKVPPAGVKAILAELVLPSLRGDDPGPLVRLPFADTALKDYAADVSVEDVLKDVDKYPLRVATLRALQAVRDNWPMGGKEQRGVGRLSADPTDDEKKAIARAQEPVAKAMARLEFELTELDELAEARAKEPKRWRAHYDFARAELRLRVALLSEYNRALGHARTETLPDLDGGSGWRLVPAAKVEGRKDVRELAQRADDALAQLARDYKGTPWEVVAKRSRAALPGTRWEPLPK